MLPDGVEFVLTEGFPIACLRALGLRTFEVHPQTYSHLAAHYAGEAAQGPDAEAVEERVRYLAWFITTMDRWVDSGPQ